MATLPPNSTPYDQRDSAVGGAWALFGITVAIVAYLVADTIWYSLCSSRRHLFTLSWGPESRRERAAECTQLWLRGLQYTIVFLLLCVIHVAPLLLLSTPGRAVFIGLVFCMDTWFVERRISDTECDTLEP